MLIFRTQIGTQIGTQTLGVLLGEPPFDPSRLSRCRVAATKPHQQSSSWPVNLVCSTQQKRQQTIVHTWFAKNHHERLWTGTLHLLCNQCDHHATLQQDWRVNCPNYTSVHTIYFMLTICCNWEFLVNQHLLKYYYIV